VPSTPTTLRAQSNARRRELGVEAVRWFIEDLGRHVPPEYLPLAREVLTDALEAVAIAEHEAGRAA
jgi:hypothetical protein